MSSNNIKPEFVPDTHSLSNEEHLYVQSVLDDENLDVRLSDATEAAQRKLWQHFQSAASSLTQLYKDRHSNQCTTWGPFQTAAGSLTHLYRDSTDEIRSSCDLAKRAGYQKCRRDLVNWARQGRRRYIRRDELLSILVSMSPGDVPVPHHPNVALAPVMEMLELSHQTRDSGSPMRHKRPPPSPSHDVQMDSPVWKKPKYN